MKGTDIEGNRLSRRPRRDSEVLGKGKKRGLAALFLLLEAVSVVLDVFGRSKRATLVAFLLAAFGFALNIYVCFVERTIAKIKPQAERQLGIVEIIFSVLQLVATFIHFILLVSDVKYNYNASVLFPLAFAIIAIVFAFQREEKVTDLSLEDLSIAKFSLVDDSVLSTPIQLDLRGSTVDHPNSVNNLHFRSRQIKEVPGIGSLQIVGEAEPGKKLMACGHSINGTTSVLFQWVRYLEDGNQQFIQVKTPEYVVTADDIDTVIGVECIPLDNQGRQGELVRAFANELCKIKCHPDMQSEIDMHISRGEATFSVLLLMDPSENWEPTTLTLRGSSYQIKINSAEAVVIEEFFSENLWIKIPAGLPTQFILTSSDGASHTFSTDYARMRDTLVLTMRMFHSKALDDKKEGKTA